MQFQRPVIIQAQKQKLSPQMIQSIKLMALPLQDLKTEIQAEIESNPALEILEDHSTLSLDKISEEHNENTSNLENENVYESETSFSKSNNDSARAFLEGAITTAETLQDHLLWQLRLQPISSIQRKIGEALIQNLDTDGFYTEDPYIVCPDQTKEQVDFVIAIIHNFEPLGVCVKDYRESLVVQAEHKFDCPKGTTILLKNYISLLEHAKYLEIQKQMAISSNTLDKILAFIKTLNPFPGRQFSTAETKYVTPDAQVGVKDNEIVITLNEEEIPVLGINPFFDQLQEEKHDKETEEFVKINIQKAKVFIQSIHQRNKTLFKVIKSIVEFQRQFFARGPKFLSPLTLKDIANQVGVHETTISRIANNKYIQTDWGLFELRYFFTNSISGSGSTGSRFSKNGVKQVIKEIIENESNAMSDQDISDILARKGIKLARRTVAKYRAELNMDSSFGRKRI